MFRSPDSGQSHESEREFRRDGRATSELPLIRDRGGTGKSGGTCTAAAMSAADADVQLGDDRVHAWQCEHCNLQFADFVEVLLRALSPRRTCAGSARASAGHIPDTGNPKPVSQCSHHEAICKAHLDAVETRAREGQTSIKWTSLQWTALAAKIVLMQRKVKVS